MVSFKSKSGKKLHFTKKSVDGSLEDKAKYKIRSLTEKINSYNQFKPELLIAMIETLSSIEEIEKKKFDFNSLWDIEYELSPAIKHIIDLYKKELEDLIKRHGFIMIEETRDYVKENQYWESKDDPLIRYIMNSEKYKERIAKNKNDTMKKFFFREILNDLEHRFDWLISIDPFLKKIFIDYWRKDKDIDVEHWLKIWELMKASLNYFQRNNSEFLWIYLKTYYPQSERGVFLNKNNLYSKFALYKELEEQIRNLEHHDGKLIKTSLITKGLDVDKFFELLNRYNEPTKEKWKEEMDELLGKL